MDKLYPCPSCHDLRVPAVAEIGRFAGWECRLYCCHASCDFKVSAYGFNRRGARRRAIKKWNRRASDG